jgi:dethiobiotin synthetase
MSKAIFVTGTDTGVGKSWVSVALMAALQQRGLRVMGMKPIASGCRLTADGLRNEDAEMLQQQASTPFAYDLVNPYRFLPAIAPHIAAAASGTTIDLARIADAAAILSAGADYLIVEGAGGWWVPLDATTTMAAIAEQGAMGVVLVVGLRLGCINHALLTAAAIAASGCPLSGWVATPIDRAMACQQENLATLRARLPAPCLGVMPWLAACDPQRLAAAIDLSQLKA